MQSSRLHPYWRQIIAAYYMQCGLHHIKDRRLGVKKSQLCCVKKIIASPVGAQAPLAIPKLWRSYSVASYIPRPYGRGVGLGYGVRTPSGEGDRGGEKLPSVRRKCGAELSAPTSTLREVVHLGDLHLLKRVGIIRPYYFVTLKTSPLTIFRYPTSCGYP